MEDNDLDIVFGSRFFGYNKSNTPKLKHITLKVVARITRILTGINLSDAHNGLRALTLEASKLVSLTQSGMAHASQIISLTRQANLKYHEVSVTILYTSCSRKKDRRS